MAEKIYEFRFQRGSATRWSDLNPTLGPGEPGVEIDTGLFKIGDGNTAWNDLDYYLTEDYIRGLVEVEIAAAGGLYTDPRVGDLDNLSTASKDLLVNAINEVSAAAASTFFYVPFGRTGPLTVFNGPKLYFDTDTEFVEGTFSVTTPPTGSPALFDVLKNGVPIYSVRPSIEASSNVSTVGTLIGTPVFASRVDSLQVQCTQIGAIEAGSDLSVLIKMKINQ